MLYDILPNKELLLSYVKDYAPYDEVTTSDSPASMSFIMRFWDQNKAKYLYKLLGNNFSIEKEFVYTLGDQEIENRLTEQMYNEEALRNFIDQFTDYVTTNFCHRRSRNMSYKWFFDSNEDLDDQYLDLYYCLRDVCNTHSLATNVYGGAAFGIPLPGEDHKVFKVSRGMKTMKILAKLAEAWGLTGFEDFRLKHSLILNQKTIKGTVGLSIHPLDYLTMSDNSLGWESCMNWTKGGGCYRMGTVEMMNSPMVLVAYLRSDKDFYFGSRSRGEKWNNKKWRNLYIINESVITGVKQYPYYNESLDKCCTDWIAELAKRNLGWEYAECQGTIKPYNENVEFEFIGSDGFTHEAGFEFSTGLMYLDFGNSNVINPRARLVDEDIYENIYYSGETECMYCGSQLDNSQEDDNEDVSSAGRVICNNCFEAIYCDCCGESIRSGDTYELDGNIYCYNCYEDRVVYDSVTEEPHDAENCETYYIVNSEKDFEDENYFYRHIREMMIYDTYDLSLLLKNRFDDMHRASVNRGVFYSNDYKYILVDSLTERGRRVLSDYLPIEDFD